MIIHLYVRLNILSNYGTKNIISFNVPFKKNKIVLEISKTLPLIKKKLIHNVMTSLKSYNFYI